jgi:hypothetical protein
VSEIVEKISKKVENKQLLTLEDIYNIRDQYLSFTLDQVITILKVLKIDVKRKKLPHPTGSLDPLKGIRQVETSSGYNIHEKLKVYLNNWILSEYLYQQRKLWEEFERGNMDFDTCLKKSVVMHNELYSLCIK